MEVYRPYPSNRCLKRSGAGVFQLQLLGEIRFIYIKKFNTLAPAASSYFYRLGRAIYGSALQRGEYVGSCIGN